MGKDTFGDKKHLKKVFCKRWNAGGMRGGDRRGNMERGVNVNKFCGNSLRTKSGEKKNESYHPGSACSGPQGLGRRSGQGVG